MPSGLRIGIVGFGRMGQEHARNIAESNQMHVALIVEPNKSNAERAVALVGDSEVRHFADLAMAVSSAPVDGWIVCSSTHSHISTALFLLERDQRILLEKPISESTESALRLRNFVLSDSSNLMMGHTVLWSPEFQELQQKVLGRGPILEITTLRQRSQSHRTDYPNDSIISLLMVHDLYCIQVLTRCMDPMALEINTRSHSSGGIDYARAQLSWSDSSTATSEVNYFLPNSPPGLIDDRITVKGNGWSEFANFQGDYDQALRNELAHFAAMLRNEVSVPVGARYQDAIQAQGWLDELISMTAAKPGEGD